MAKDARLADFTTLRIGGPADQLIEVTTEQELIDAVREADAAAQPVLLLSGGSNVVIGAGSVVTRDIPDNVVAVGNPCRVIRTIESDEQRKEG